MVRSIRIFKDHESVQNYALHEIDGKFTYTYHDKTKETILDEESANFKIAKKLFEPYLKNLNIMADGDEKDIFLF